MSITQNWKDFKIEDSVINRIQGNATIIRFGDGTLTGSEVEEFMTGRVIALPDISHKEIERHSLLLSITNLPCTGAGHNDHRLRENGQCLKGTRETLLRELASWVLDPTKSQIYVLSGLAGIGKSTVAYTFASRADQLGLLGASFFFSRDESDRKTAKKLFTTMAFQLCVYDEKFAQAIGEALLKQRGAAAITKDVNEQLEALILEPLRVIVKSRIQPTVIVIDALDECDNRDAPAVLASLQRLVHELPSFKVLLTTRPQPLDHRLSCHDVFHFQNMEDKVINNDIRLYLKSSLSKKNVEEYLPDLRSEWGATDDETEHIARAAGKLFIIASTAVRFILDRVARNPASQLGILKDSSQLRSGNLEGFYTIILRRALPEKCSAEMMKRFKAVIGAILFVQEPLPVTALQHLTFPYSAYDVGAVVGNLKSVISGTDGIPRVYHPSFSDFLTETCGETLDIGIISDGQHRLLATCCLRILNERLKRNILDIKGPARFLDNAAGLERQAISDERFREKIPLELDYACKYWATHLESANVVNLDTNHQELMEEFSRFANGHLLHWIEVMSWICKLDLAFHALRVVQVALKPTCKDLRELFSDALRFISKFYILIQQSALHTYYSALPFTPTETLLYKRYHQEMVDNICQVQGVPEEWSPIIANPSHGVEVDQVMFSQDSSMFASLSESSVKFWDAVTGVPLGTIVGKIMAIADGFSLAASFDGSTIALYDIKSCTYVTTLSVAPARVVKVAISPDGRRIAAGLSDETMRLWDWKKAEPVVRLDKFAWDKTRDHCCLTFNSSGDRLAFGSNGGVKLLNGINGEFVADLLLGKPDHHPRVAFSRDGSRIAYLAQSQLSLWDGKTGILIGVTKLRVPGDTIGISANGSLIAIHQGEVVTLWGGNSDNSLKMVETIKLGSSMCRDRSALSLTFFRDDMLIIECISGRLWLFATVYDTMNRCFITTLPPFVALSSDSTRFATRTGNGTLELWETPSSIFKGRERQKKVLSFASRFLQSAKALFSLSKEPATFINDVALSPYSQLASCHNSTVDLWDISCARQPIGTLKASAEVISCVFSADGGHLAFALLGGIIKFWRVKDRTFIGTLKQKYPKATSMVFLRGMFAVGSKHHDKVHGDITLWDLKTLRRIITITKDFWPELLSFFHHDTMFAYYDRRTVPEDVDVTVWDVEKRRQYAKVKLGPDSWIDSAETALLSPDQSKLVVQLVNGQLKIFNLINGYEVMIATRREDLDWDWLPPIRRWHGIPVWLHESEEDDSHSVSGFSSHSGASMPLFRLPLDLRVRRVARGSSTFAILHGANRIVLLKEYSSGTCN